MPKLAKPGSVLRIGLLATFTAPLITQTQNSSHRKKMITMVIPPALAMLKDPRRSAVSTPRNTPTLAAVPEPPRWVSLCSMKLFGDLETPAHSMAGGMSGPPAAS